MGRAAEIAEAWGQATLKLLLNAPLTRTQILIVEHFRPDLLDDNLDQQDRQRTLYVVMMVVLAEPASGSGEGSTTLPLSSASPPSP